MATLKIKTAPTIEPVTRDEAKAYCRIDGAEDDLLIDSLITAARQYVEGLCGPLINQTWYQYDQDWPDDYVLQIGKPRMSSGTAPVVKYTDEDGTQSTLTASWYTVRITDEYWSQIVLKSDYSWPPDALFNVDPIMTESVCGYGAAARRPCSRCTSGPADLRGECVEEHGAGFEGRGRELPDLLAVDRKNEHHNTRAAAEAGVGPEGDPPPAGP